MYEGAFVSYLVIVTNFPMLETSVFGRLFVKWFALWFWTVVLCLSVCPVSLSVCNVGVLWPNGWIDQDET